MVDNRLKIEEKLIPEDDEDMPLCISCRHLHIQPDLDQHQDLIIFHFCKKIK